MNSGSRVQQRPGLTDAASNRGVRKWLRASLLVLAGTLLGLAFLEVVCLRLLFGYHASADPSTLFLYDELYGWRLKPGATAIHSALEFKVHHRTNSKGLRDREFAYEKPAGIFRILALGDSLTEGFGVEMEETYPKRLETLMNESGGKRVEVINAGLRGTSTDQQYLFLTREGLKYRPDVVMLAFVDGDENNTPSAGWIDPTRDYRKPFFRLSGNQLSLEGIPVPNVPRKHKLAPIEIVLTRFVLYDWTQLVLENRRSPLYRVLQAIGVAQPTLSKLGPDGVPGSFGAEAWRVEKRLLEEMKIIVEREGGRLMIFFAAGDSAYNQMLQKICLELGIRYFDLANHPDFAEGYRKGDFRFRYDGHWNAAGHRRVAEILRNFVVKNFLGTS